MVRIKIFVLATLLLMPVLTSTAHAATRLNSYSIECSKDARAVVSFSHQLLHNVLLLSNACKDGVPGYYLGTPVNTARYAWQTFPQTLDGSLMNTTMTMEVDSLSGVAGVETAHCSITTDADQLTYTCIARTIDPNRLVHATVHMFISR